VVLALAGCSGSTGHAPASRYSSTYPAHFATTWAQSCAKARATPAMCECALARMQAAVSYVTLVRQAPAIAEAGNPPAWWNSMQPACRRHGAGDPAYAPPLSLDFLLPPAPPAAEVEQALNAVIQACIGHSFGSTAPPLPAGATQGTNTLLRLAGKYSLTKPLSTSIGKVKTLGEAISGARVFLNERSCSPSDAARLSDALSGR
jgi:hypothetical protein